MALNTTEAQTPAPGIDRRGVLRAAGVGAAAGTLATGGLALGSLPARAQTLTDTDILNFALNFEYLGAEYYLHGLTGMGLPASLTSGTGTKGTVTSGGPVAFQDPAIKQYVQRLAADEQGHVIFLRAVLGSSAIAEPTIDLGANWSILALAAGLIAFGQEFNPYGSDVGFLLGAYVLEDVCVTALAGAAALLTNKDNLEGAAGLLGTEGYQAGAIRTLLANIGAGQATDAISNLRARLSGVADDVGTSVPGQPYSFTNTDSNALVFRRTPAQVLNIAYGGVATGGGFFPNRVNGTINTATASTGTGVSSTGTSSSAMPSTSTSG